MIWNGYGYLVIVITLLSETVMTFVLEGIMKLNPGVGLFAGALIAAAILWIAGTAYNRRKHTEIIVDKKTGTEQTRQLYHSFLSVRLQYWGLIMAGIAGLILIWLVGNR